jgi:hypothetical protein
MTSVQFQGRNRHNGFVPNLGGAFANQNARLHQIDDRHDDAVLRNEFAPPKTRTVDPNVSATCAFAGNVRYEKFGCSIEVGIPTHGCCSPAAAFERLSKHHPQLQNVCTLNVALPTYARHNCTALRKVVAGKIRTEKSFVNLAAFVAGFRSGTLNDYSSNAHSGPYFYGCAA